MGVRSCIKERFLLWTFLVTHHPYSTVSSSNLPNANMNILAATVLSALILLPLCSHAQNLVERRDQATGWYVPVKVHVGTRGTTAGTVDVRVYKENGLIHEVPGSNYRFTVNLDLGSIYTLVIAKDGYRDKMVMIDTHVPDDQVEYPEYACVLDLEPASWFNHADPFYLDFPGAIVRWNNKAEAFTPQLDYLTDIQSKVAMLRAQMDPH